MSRGILAVLTKTHLGKNPDYSEQQEESDLSDLASSCEYHTTEKTCFAVSENPKAQANRQLRCLNDDKQSCCYICDSKQECTISCKYLGTTEPKTQTHPEPEASKAATPPSPVNNPVEVNEIKGIPAAYCTSCNVEMAPKKAKITIDNGSGNQSKQFGDYTPQTEETLPVIVYLCPLCGRIEFRANRGT